MAAQRQSTARPAHTKTTEPCQSPKPINPSRQNSIVVPVTVDDLTFLDPGNEEAKRELNREAERRTLFQNVSNGVLQIPNGYRKVEVLIIRWDESVDEFKGHEQEAALMWDRLQRYKRNVELGRLDPNPERDESFRNEEPEKASLVLRFSLKEEALGNSQVEMLARQLPAVFKEAGVLVRRMEYVELERRDDVAKAFRAEPGRPYDPAKAFRKVVHQVQENISSDKIGHGEHEKQSATLKPRKRKSSYSDTLLAPKRNARESSLTSEEATDSGLCTPPKRHTKPGSEAHKC
ncbi:hypothetical protein J4E93_006565 [Alternaria ventricosa]|uniref:uncharacterized protein n=1 Tax=Alternaria ventricosa TaxID=1187951 RepID=UPI0020C1E7BC|nr:uncharacterized protein J4E93_006565 [Alternaria ventricosa]KAI4643555.1 hypothetical protein J4E93_006565 [Alternaria ventricosa]